MSLPIRLFDPADDSRPPDSAPSTADLDPAAPRTVRELAAAFIADRERDVAAEYIGRRHFESLHYYCRSFVAMFGACAVEKVPRKALRLWLREHREWKSANTIDKALGSVLAMLDWAESEEEWEGVRVPRLRRPKEIIPGRPVRPPLLIDQYEAIMREARSCLPRHRLRRRRPTLLWQLKTCPHKASRKTAVNFRCLLYFLWRTGRRCIEGRTAKFSQIVWTPGDEHIVLTEHKTGHKTGAPLKIALDRECVRLLRMLQRFRLPGQTHIFTNGQGRAWSCNGFADQFRRYADFVGVPRDVSAYCCRHSLICRVIESSGGDEGKAADAVGHSTTRQTRRYSAWLKQQTKYVRRTIRLANDEDDERGPAA